MINNSEDIFFSLFFLFFILTGLAWIIFAQFSMRPIEKSTKADATPDGFTWDG